MTEDDIFDASDDMFEESESEESQVPSKQGQAQSSLGSFLSNVSMDISDNSMITDQDTVQVLEEESKGHNLNKESNTNNENYQIKSCFDDMTQENKNMLSEDSVVISAQSPVNDPALSSVDYQTQSPIDDPALTSIDYQVQSPIDDSASISLHGEQPFNSTLLKQNIPSELNINNEVAQSFIAFPDQVNAGCMSLNDKRQLKTDLVFEDQDKQSLPITCPFCGTCQDSINTLEVHIQLSHPENGNVEIDVATNTCDSDNGYCFLGVCPYCDIDLGDTLTLQVHINTVHEDDCSDKAVTEFNCPLCDTVCSSDHDMKHHLETHSNDGTVYGVSLCPEVSSVMACPVCGLTLTDSDLMNSHVEGHFNPQHSLGVDLVPNSFSGNSIQLNANKFLIDSESPKSNENEEKKENPNTVARNPSITSSASNADRSGLTRNNTLPLSSKNSFQSSNSGGSFSYRKQYEQNLQKAVFRGQVSVPDYHEQMKSMAQNDLRGVDDGSTRVTGLIQKLETLYRTQARQGQSAILCSPADHYSASYGDKGWGCGYRNFQMILSCLSSSPEFAAKIFPDQQKSIPSIPKIQEMIECAWKNGFDRQGCLQLNGKLVNTKKWIGATEIVATLSYLGIKCQLIDFHAPSSDDGTHPRLLEWVSDYFRTTQINGLGRPPLYLQHQGHSRTIIGVEFDTRATKLLLFDPGTPRDELARLARGSLGWKDLRTFRRTQAGFRAKQYQIVAVIGLLSQAEYNSSKILKSERID
uniref:Znf1 protein n=1 Tax=Biomphalaria glabrata TaxID=6526 RepID=A0A0C9RFI8_BIOGL